MNKLWKLASLVTRPKPPVGTTPADVVFRENKWRLLRYRAKNPSTYKTPVLLVPSLINRHYVMDLLPGKSMAEDLVKMGHDVFCIDWGTPEDEDRFVTFDDVADKWLGRAIRKAARMSARKKVHVLGYCLGGTLAAIHAAVHQEHIASLFLLAAPVAFDDGGLLASWTRSESFRVGDVVAACGNVPWQLMQGAFHLLRPTLSLSKGVTILDRLENDEFLDGFFALETWGNDNVSFPGECYRRYIEELYRGDALMKGEFSLSGNRVRLENITVPTTAVVFQHDNIVPLKSASVLLDRISSKDKILLELPGGHVGAVVSRSAQKNLWPKMSAFWATRDADPKPVPAPQPAPPKAASTVKAKPRRPTRSRRALQPGSTSE